MNNPFEFQNDLNAFRGAIAGEQAKYDNRVNILQNTQLAKRTKALNKAKAFAEKGEELVKQGLEAAAVPHLGKLTYKGAKSIYNKIRSRNVASRQAGDEDIEETSDIPGSSTSAEASEGTQLQSVSNEGGGEVEMTNLAEAGDAEGTEMSRMVDVGGRTGTNPGATEEAERYEQEGLGNEGMTDEQLHNINERASMRQNDIDAPEEPGQVRPRGNAVEDQDSLGENTGRGADNLGEDIAEDAGDAEDAGADLASGAADALSGVGSGVEAAAGAASAAGEAAAGAAAGIEGVAGGLAEAAAATSWVPFLGEILGAAAGIAGLAGAGVGVYEEIAGGAQEAAAEKIPATLNKNQLPSSSVAGGYIAPLASSVQM